MPPFLGDYITAAAVTGRRRSKHCLEVTVITVSLDYVDRKQRPLCYQLLPKPAKETPLCHLGDFYSLFLLKVRSHNCKTHQHDQTEEDSCKGCDKLISKRKPTVDGG